MIVQLRLNSEVIALNVEKVLKRMKNYSITWIVHMSTITAIIMKAMFVVKIVR